eukprot:4889340-Amphidinium_carterae.1
MLLDMTFLESHTNRLIDDEEEDDEEDDDDDGDDLLGPKYITVLRVFGSWALSLLYGFSVLASWGLRVVCDSSLVHAAP